VTTSSGGNPLVDDEGYSEWPLGVTTWWTNDVQTCFPAPGTTMCTNYNDQAGTLFDPRTPTSTRVIDPQIGWEQQKFLIAQTLMYLVDNERTEWFDMMRLWRLGSDADPAFTNRIEFHDPSGQVWVAKTYGKETIFGKEVQRGIAARVLEFANEMLVLAYETTPGPDLDGDAAPDWYIPVITDGKAEVMFNPDTLWLNEAGTQFNGSPPADCNGTDNSGCECGDNVFCVRMANHVPVIAFLRQAFTDFDYVDGSQIGVED
jgi:hypothetical protein